MKIIPAAAGTSAFVIEADANMVVTSIKETTVIGWRITPSLALPVIAFEVDPATTDIFPVDAHTGGVIHPLHGQFSTLQDLIDNCYLGEATP